MNTQSKIYNIIKTYWVATMSITGFMLMLAVGANSQDHVAPNEKATIESDYLVNKGDDGFEQRLDVTPDVSCSDPDVYNCVYNITPLGKMNIPEQSSYTQAEINSYESQNWITPHPDSSPGLYAN